MSLLTLSETPTLEAGSLCAHCGLPSSYGRFCCSGCEFVFELIHEKGLGDFYRIKDRGSLIRSAQPATLPSPIYSHIDDPEFLRLYALPAAATSDDRVMQFYLEGVHCTACLWLIEKVGTWVQGVRSVRLDLGHSLVSVRMSAVGSFAEVAHAFAQLGYRPHPVKQDEALRLETRENRRALIRTAIAGAAAGNIMLLAISVYGGATGSMAESFEWISFGICLPVATYCAWPFYRSAWSAVRTRQLSIDIPIALGLAIAFLASIGSLLGGGKLVYFDTVAALVFLLLASRYVLRKTQQQASRASRLVHFLVPSWVRRKVGDTFEEVRVDDLKVGDQVMVFAGECMPVDGIVCSGVSTVNSALITGEARHELAQPGTFVYAGTLNQQAPLQIEVKEAAAATRLGRMIQSMEESLTRKAPIVAFTDLISKKFIIVSLLLVFVAFFVGLSVSRSEALSRALAMAIVACPCAFAFATPLAFSTVMGRCARNGVLIKGADVLEKLAHVERVVLDKTGTLTTGEFQVKSWPERCLTADILSVVYALESRSAHPLARAICKFLINRKMVSPIALGVSDFEERIGSGVSGCVAGVQYRLGKKYESESVTGSEKGTRVVIEREGAILGEVILADGLRDDSLLAIRALKKLGLRVGILSGDHTTAVQGAATALGIPLEEAVAEATPESKSAYIKKFKNTLMVGDGANDAVALASSYVGVAVHSGMEISMRAADVYQCNAGVMPVVQLITVARETLKVVHRGFAFSLLYNAIGAWAAITGHVNPLFAAVLMPASALTVFTSAIYGTPKLRKAWS